MEKMYQRSKQYLVVTILTFVILAGVVCLSELQRFSMTIKTDLANLEYLSAATQRLLKLSVSERDYDVLYSFLDQEHERILNNDHSDDMGLIPIPVHGDMIDQIAQSWEEVKACLGAEEFSKDVLNLVSDNHYFKVSNLTTELNKLEVYAENHIERLTHILHFLSMLFAVLLLYHHKNNTLLEKRAKSLAEIATIDQATGLYNRTKCQELFQQPVASSQAQAVMVYDLNDLKKTNDTKGHRMGDALITAFSNSLADVGACYSKPPFIGRYGGDEFIVCFEDLENPSEVTRFLENMEKTVAIYNQQDNEFVVSFAVGFAIGEREDSRSLKNLFDEADEKMYINKQMKKNGGTLPNGADIQIQNHEDEKPSPEEIKNMETTFAIEKRSELGRKKNFHLLVAMSCLLVLGYGLFFTHRLHNRDYIAGNVMYLPIISSSETDVGSAISISSPWKNSSFVNMLIYRGLFSMDSNFVEIVPDLATGYEVSEDGLTYTVTLKSGLKWSDGVDLTVDDLVFSFEAFLLCSDVNGYVGSALQIIDGYDEFVSGAQSSLSGLRVDGNSLHITLDHPYSNFPIVLAQFVPFPAHILSDVESGTLTTDIDYYRLPVSSGMYMVEQRGDQTVLVHNPYYGSTYSDIDEIVLLTQFSPLDLDYYSTNNVTEMVDYRSIRGFEEYPIDSYFYRYFVYNIQGRAESEKENPMENLRVRQAIAYAIDSEALLDNVYFNAGSLLTFGVLDEITGADLVFAYNPTLAMELLDEANYDFHRPIRISYYYTDETSLIFLEKVKGYLEDVGLTVELERANSSYDLYDLRDYDLMLKGLSSFNYESWYQEFYSTSPNISKVFGTDEFDPLIYDLRISQDGEAYEDALERLKALEKDLLYKLPLFTLNQSVYINSNRLVVPDDITFGNNLFRFDIRFDEWSILKG